MKHPLKNAIPHALAALVIILALLTAPLKEAQAASRVARNADAQPMVQPRVQPDVRPRVQQSVTLTQDQVREMYLASAANIPQTLLTMGFSKIGELDLKAFLKNLPTLPVEFVPWTQSPNGTTSARYFTRFTHTASPSSALQNKVFVNAKLWFTLTPDAKAAVALNGALSAFGYNDALYQMTTALWFFSQPTLRRAMSEGEFNYAWNLVQQLAVKLPDANGPQSEDPSEPLLSQLPPHFGKMTQKSDNMPSFGSFHSKGLTIYLPVDTKLESPSSSAYLKTAPFIPSYALTSGGGDWGGILMKQSMIRGNLSKQNSGMEDGKGKLLEGFRLTMALNFEINWLISETE